MASTRAAEAAPTIEVHGDVHGSIVYGDHNFVVNTNHGTIVYQAARPQVSRRAAVPPAPRPPLLFLDRAEELGRIAAALKEPAPVALYGPEGVGKSTLMRQAAAALPRPDYPDGVVLINGPGATGTPQGLDDLAQTAFNALFESDPPLKVTAAEARTHLGGVRALFVLDELALPPEALARLPDLVTAGGLMWAAPHPPRGETARSLAVGGLPRPEAMALLARTAEVEFAPGDQATVDEICRLTDDLPLGIVTVGRWMRERRATPAQALLILKGQAARRETDGGRRAVAGVLVWLDSAARRLFGLAATAGGPAVDRAALLEASGLPEATASAGLAQLEAYGLLQAHSPALGMPPLYKQFARERYRASPERRNLLHDILFREAEAHRGDWDYLRAEMGNLLGALEYAVADGNFERAAAIARLIVPLLVLRGRWDVWYYVFQRLAGQATDRAAQAWALHELGTRAFALGDRAGAARLLQEALHLRQSLGDQTGAAYTRHNLRFVTGAPPPQQGQPPRPPAGRPWLTILIAAGLGGLGVLAVVGVLAAAVYCVAFGCLPARPVEPSDTPTPAVEVQLPATTATPTPRHTPRVNPSATRPPPITDTRRPSATPTRRPTQTASVTATGTPTPTAPPILLTLTPVADAYVDSLYTEMNFGKAPELVVGYSPDPEFPATARTFIRFDVSKIPFGAEIQEAALALTLVGEYDPAWATNLISAASVQNPWDELKITWFNAQPIFADDYDLIEVPPQPGLYEWDLTELVQGWVSGDFPNYGLVLIGIEDGEYNARLFGSRESDTDPPLLLITYASP